MTTTQPGRPAPALWRAFGALVVVATLGWGTYNVVSVLAHEERTETTSFPRLDVESVTVRNGGGSVRVVAGDGDDIVVTAEISDGLRETGNRQEIVDGELQITGSCPNIGETWCSIHYTVHAPSDLALTVDVEDSRVVVTGMHGPLDLANDHGRTEVDDPRGDLRISNDHGDITATRVASSVVEVDNDHGDIGLSFVEAPMALTVENDHGDIDIELPDAADAYRLDVDARDGDVDELIRSDPASDHSIRARNDHGDVTVRYAG